MHTGQVSFQHFLERHEVTVPSSHRGFGFEQGNITLHNNLVVGVGRSRGAMGAWVLDLDLEGVLGLLVYVHLQMPEPMPGRIPAGLVAQARGHGHELRGHLYEQIKSACNRRELVSGLLLTEVSRTLLGCAVWAYDP